SNQEITAGDRLVAIDDKTSFRSAVRPANAGLDARIVKVHDPKPSSLLTESGLALRTYDREGGPLSVGVINKGRTPGIEEGKVIKLVSKGATIGRSGTFGYLNGEPARPQVKLPDEENGQAVVFRTFEKVSYALVMRAQRPISGGDRVVAP